MQVLPDWTFKTRYSGDARLLYPPSRYQPPHMMVFIDYLVKNCGHKKAPLRRFLYLSD